MAAKEHRVKETLETRKTPLGSISFPDVASANSGIFHGWIGRRTTIILGCLIFIVGVLLQTASTAVNLLTGGRVIAGMGVGFVSVIIILYMSEIAPMAVRGMIVAG